MTVGAASRSQRFGAWLMHRGRHGCERLARLESRLAASAIAQVSIRQPVFIAGVARSGSTILLEALASGDEFASLRYCDYPPVWFPWWWPALRSRLPLPRAAPRERAHADGIEVTPESPEAFDEVFWMHFFAQRHAAGVDQRLGATTQHPRFEHFYRLQIRKVLAARARSRYLCKGNYNLARMAYLHALFPDARFVVPIRSPETHVASLCRQHQRFMQLAASAPGVGAYLARSGHFEFGPQRSVECVGDPGEAEGVRADFAAGDDVSGYARQWAMSYGALAESLAQDPALSAATLLVRYEDVCRAPAATLRRLAAHCALGPDESCKLVARWEARLRAPDYYRPGLQAHERARVLDLVATTAQRFGYDV
jgi:hypothetical protein